MIKKDRLKPLRLWLMLVVIAGAPRVLSVFLLPNAFGDAYAYIQEIGTLTAKISNGSFRLVDLYGFWLPLYQLICALVSAFAGHTFYVARLVAALSGIGICLLVYDITFRLTKHRTASLLVFTMVALSPLHIFNSASAMTDMPHAFFVLACLNFVLRKRWVMAALCGALAGLVRMDSWIIIALLPAIQFYEERRISPAALGLLLLPPVFWLYISWQATGDWLACFRIRKQYMDALFIANPSLASFSLKAVARDTGALLLGTDLTVLVAALFAAWLIIKASRLSLAEHRQEPLRAATAVNLFFLTYLAFLALAYLTHKQPIIFPRYGLILFALGLPLLPWTFFALTKGRSHDWARKLLLTIVILSLLNVCAQLAYSVGYIKREYAHEKVADYLRAHFQASADARIFSDDGTVRALSGIPEERFCSSMAAPREREGFLAYLKEQRVTYLVYVEMPGSVVPQLFPELGKGTGNEVFQPVAHASSSFLRTDIWLYRVRGLDK